MSENVPFFRPNISEDAIASVAESLRSGWLTSGPKVKAFEENFAKAVGGSHAVALNSATAALHLSLRALGLTSGDGVLVPTHTFAATAEVVQYHGGVPILVDCHSDTFNIDLAHAKQQIDRAGRGELPVEADRIVGIMPVHVAGNMIDMDELNRFAKDHELWVVEDSAHAFPAGFVRSATGKPDTVMSGSGTANATCFSFYANKTITTGEGGMLVTEDEELAATVRSLSLHGLSTAAWKRFEPGANWDYQITNVGFKYNLTDLAAAIGLEQLKRAETFRVQRSEIANFYFAQLHDLTALTLPEKGENRLHSWHLFILKLNLDQLSITRNQFCEKLKENGVGFSVHWRPLHLHPHYKELGWKPEDMPTATSCFERIVSLPIFPGMTPQEQQRVVDVVRSICTQNQATQSQGGSPSNAPSQVNSIT